MRKMQRGGWTGLLAIIFWCLCWPVHGQETELVLTILAGGEAFRGSPILGIYGDGQKLAEFEIVNALSGEAPASDDSDLFDVNYRKYSLDVPKLDEISTFEIQVENDVWAEDGKSVDSNLWIKSIKVGGLNFSPEQIAVLSRSANIKAERIILSGPGKLVVSRPANGWRHQDNVECGKGNSLQLSDLRENEFALNDREVEALKAYISSSKGRCSVILTVFSTEGERASGDNLRRLRSIAVLTELADFGIPAASVKVVHKGGKPAVSVELEKSDGF
jgi:hypothetical protein